MAPADLRTRADDLDESIWNNLLLAGRPARVSRHRRSDHALIVAIFRFGRPRGRGAVAPRGSALDVLAFCGCRVGGGFHRCLRSGALRRQKWQHLLTTEQMSESPRAPREIEVPAPTAWPFVLAFGFTLVCAGLVTSMSVSVLGAVLVSGRLRRLVSRSLSSRARRGCAGGSRRHSHNHRAPRWLSASRSDIICGHGFL